MYSVASAQCDMGVCALLCASTNTRTLNALLNGPRTYQTHDERAHEPICSMVRIGAAPARAVLKVQAPDHRATALRHVFLR